MSTAYGSARLSVINRIVKLINSSLSLDQQLQIAIEAISEHFQFEHLAIGLVSPTEPDVLVLHAQTGHAAFRMPKGYRHRIGTGIVGDAARARRPILVNDVTRDPRYLPIPNAPPIYAELAMPILFGEQLVGLLNLEAANAIDEELAADLEMIAEQLGIAINNARLFGQMQAALAELRLLYETSARISAALTLDEVVAAYLEQVATRGRFRCSILLYEFGEDGQPVNRIILGRWSPTQGLELRHTRIPYTRDALDPLLERGETLIFNNTLEDARVPEGLRALQKQTGQLALAFIPLIVRGQRIGLIALSYATAYVWQDTELRPYQITASQLATTIANRRQQLLLSQHESQLAVLEERQRLARDLHDSVTQHIFSLSLIAQSLGAAWRRDPSEGEKRAGRMIALSQKALAEMRALLVELRPAAQARERPIEPTTPMSEAMPSELERLQQQGLVAVLHQHIGELVSSGLHIKLNTEAYEIASKHASPADEECLYRIAQEALNNVIKHARARHVHLSLSATPESFGLTIKDDGIGFETTLARQAQPGLSDGLGLGIMRERAAALGGTFQITSAPQQGTTIEVVLPRSGEGVT